MAPKARVPKTTRTAAPAAAAAAAAGSTAASTSYFSNIMKTGNDMTVTFDIHRRNQINVSLLNALRRIILSNIHMYAIDPDQCQFTKNTSGMYTSLIAQRLSLCPIKCSRTQPIQYTDYTIQIDLLNRSDDTLTVMLSHFQVSKKHSEVRTLTINDLFAYPNTPITQLKPGEQLTGEAHIHSGTCATHDASLTAVGTVTYEFKQDPARIAAHIEEKGLEGVALRHFLTADVERLYHIDETGQPSITTFTIESTGSIPATEIMTLAIEFLIQKVRIMMDACRSKDDEVVTFTTETTTETETPYLQVHLQGEDHTMGNLYTQYMAHFLPDVFNAEMSSFVGYKITHPLEEHLIISLHTANMTLDTAEEVGISIMMQCSERLLTLLNTILTQWTESI